MKGGFREAAFLIVISLILGIATYALHPKAPDWLKSRLSEGGLSIAYIDRNFESILWIDARNVEAFEEDHIPQSILLNEDNWEEGFQQLIPIWDPAQTIIVYCDGGTCQSSKAVMNRLKVELGSDNVYYLNGGFPEWKSHYN